MKSMLALYRFYWWRFLLTFLSIVIASASLNTLLTVKQCIVAHSEKMLEKYGKNRFVINLAVIDSHHKKNAKAILNVEQVMKFCDDLEPQYKLQPFQMLSKPVFYQQQELSSYLIASTPQWLQQLDWKTAQGRALHMLDNRSRVVIIGNHLAKKIEQQSQKSALNQSIIIQDGYFEVVGVLEPLDYLPLFDFDPNHSVFIALPWLQRLASAQWLDSFLVTTNPKLRLKAEQEDVMRQFIENALATRIFIRDPSFFQNALLKQVYLTVQTLKVICFITFVVAFATLFNLFCVLIDQRKQEMGIRFVLGAKPFNLRRQFLQEFMALSLVGGLFGIVMGQFCAYIIVSRLSVSYLMLWHATLLSFCAALVLSTMVAFIPVWFASRKQVSQLINQT